MIIQQTYINEIDRLKRVIKNEESRNSVMDDDGYESMIKLTEPDSVASRKQQSTQKSLIKPRSQRKTKSKPKNTGSDIMGMNSPTKKKPEAR